MAKIDEEEMALIFMPELMGKMYQFKQKRHRLVHYTSAHAAASIIQNKEVWLRNVQDMNDYSEVSHGFDLLADAYRSDELGNPFKETINSIASGLTDELEKRFDAWFPIFKTKTYILCLSEHLDNEDEYGRLSMWRAYGGDRSVALVLNPDIFSLETDAMAAYTYPIQYWDTKKFSEEFSSLTSRIKENKELLMSTGEEYLLRTLFHLFTTYALCTKHPGFSEEKEWRVIFNQPYRDSTYIRSSIESINGVPQQIYKIPLENIPDENFIHAEIPELINRIIIGPNDKQLLLGDTFIELLKQAGCEDATSRVDYSGIPLR